MTTLLRLLIAVVLFAAAVLPQLAGGQGTTNSRTQGQLDDTATVTCSEDGYCSVRITPGRALHLNLRDSAGRELGTVLPSQPSVPIAITPMPTFPPPPRLGPGWPIINVPQGQPIGTPVKIATAMGAQSSTGLRPQIFCDASKKIDTAASGSTEIIPAVPGKSIYICGGDWVSTSALSVKVVFGTGTNCATGATDLEGAQAFAATGGKVIPVMMPKWFVPAGNAFCINLSGATQVSGSVTFSQF